MSAPAPHQFGSTDYIKRFSICACLTLFMEDTYAAMGMGTDLFNKKAVAGQRLVMPGIDHWPKEHGPKVYKIPKKIDTFMYSPFVESTAGFFDMGDGVRQAFRLRGPKLLALGLAKQIPRPSLEQWAKDMQAMDKKISEMWPDATKILIFYDHSRIRSEATRNMLERWNQTALDAVGCLI